MNVHPGGCACGAVRFEVTGDLPPADACHCRACRKTTGHFLVSTDVPRPALSVGGAEHLRWYASSPAVRRGFCVECGSTLFWDPVGRDWTEVAMGAFDGSTGGRIALHVHAAEKGDYYTLADGVPAYATVPTS